MTAAFRKYLLGCLTMALALVSHLAWCCPESKAWNNFSAMSVSFPSGSIASLSFVRFIDGLYLRIENDKSVKEMYQLEGISLFKGYDPAQDAGPSPFFMLDMPVSIILNLLAGYFPQPCAVPAAPTPFEYSINIGQKKIAVRGNAHLATPTSVVFDLSDLDLQQAGGKFKTSGTIEFLDIQPLSPDMDISGWIVPRATASDAGTIGRPADATTLGELRKKIQGSKNR